MPSAGRELEIPRHGRGSQDGVTCAKFLAMVYAGLGRAPVQGAIDRRWRELRRAVRAARGREREEA
jgi:hypothetical protein